MSNHVPKKQLSLAEILKRRSYGENNINAGRLREFPWICIDKFYGEHLSSTIFVLTHCHTDHMVGLDEVEFWKRLQEPGVKLYMSEITSRLIPLFEHCLRGKDGIKNLMAANKLITLPVLQTVEMEEPTTGTVIAMTLLPAGHCPGSIMLQFEYDDQCILYNGDCRISVSDLAKLPSLHTIKRDRVGNEEKKLKEITHLYVDTTFCSSRSQDFPGRIDILDELVVEVQKWFRRHKDNCINLSFAGRFSHEYVITRFFKEFKLKTHINSDRFEAYSKIPKLNQSVTQSSNTKFHLCDKDSTCLINYAGGNSKRILTIRLSSMWFMDTENGKRPEYAMKLEKSKYQITVCYAMHSSLDEIGQMINYLKPKVVTPLVLPSRVNRKQLESELRSSACGSFVYEDYINGMNTPTILHVKKVPENDPKELKRSSSSSSLNVSPLPRRKRIEYNWSPSPSPPSSPSLLEID